MGKSLKKQKVSTGQEEQNWEAETDSANTSVDRVPLIVLVGGGVIFLVLAVVAVRYWQPEPTGNQVLIIPIPPVLKMADEDKPPIFTRPPLEIAEIFLSTSDPEERLKWVKNPARTRAHMQHYSAQALRATSDQLTPMGMGGTRHFVFARFKAAFSNEDTRHLFIIATPNGPLVDWDAYARYNSASWLDILSGQETSAEVRVFAQHSDYYNYSYRDESEWSCYRLTSPDLKEAVYAYVKKNSKQELALARVPSDDQAVPVVLGISTTKEGLQHRQLTIDRVYAFSWMRGDHDLDEESVLENRTSPHPQG